LRTTNFDSIPVSTDQFAQVVRPYTLLPRVIATKRTLNTNVSIVPTYTNIPRRVMSLRSLSRRYNFCAIEDTTSPYDLKFLSRTASRFSPYARAGNQPGVG